MVRCRIWMLLVLWCCGFSAYSQTTVQLIDTSETLRVTSNYKVLHETDKPLNIDQVIAKTHQFNWPLGNNHNFGFTDKGIWFYLQVSNVSDVKDWVIDIAYAQNDIVDFYLVKNGRVIKQLKQGKLATEHRYRLPTMAFTLPDATPYDLYIRVQSHSVSRIVPIDIQTAAHHDEMSMIDSLMWGVYYGGLIMLVIYSVVLYMARMEIASLAYVGYLVAAIIWQFVWGGHIQMVSNGSVAHWLNNHTDIVFIMVGLSSAWFTLTFLNSPVTAPRSHVVLRIVIIAMVLTALSSIFDLFTASVQNTLVYVVSIVGLTTYLLAGFESYFYGYTPARYFIFAWSVLLTCAMVAVLSLVGIVPPNSISSYCFQVGIWCEAAMFTIALLEKGRHEMDMEIANYMKEMRQNLELIEEKNAHLDIARKDAIKASQVKSQFLANMSHEIRTPLNAILGFSKELQNNTVDHSCQEHARIVNSAATNLLEIINDVLDFSKIEAGKLQVNSEPFSPHQLLDEVIGLMSKTAHDKKLEFIFESDPLPNKLIGDASRLRQILTNLLGNAIKFTPKGHVKLKIRGHQSHGALWLTFEVEDTGIGISSNQQKVLFKPFSQVDDALNRQFQGTGLGLVISQQLAQLMHGQIQVSSKMGKGSHFSATVRTQILAEQNFSVYRHQWQQQKVCVSENYEPARKAMENMLVQLGATIQSCEEGPVDYLFYTSDHCLEPHVRKRIEAYQAKHKILIHSSRLSAEDSKELAHTFDAKIEKPLLPGKLDKLFEQQPQQESNTIKQHLDNLPTVKMLAVDDMEFNLRLIRTWLKNSAVELATSLSGQDAITRCEKEAFDLILMDVQMPNMDGVQAAKGIRKTDLNRGTPIVATTAHALKEEQDRLLASGMDDYLPKPIEMEALIELIERWCQPAGSPRHNSIDWQLALQKSRDNGPLATDMLDEFLAQLPALQQSINAAIENNDYQLCQQQVHKLHGACCYTGVPKLQALCDEWESQLKRQQYEQVNAMHEQFNLECEQVIAEGRQQLDGKPDSAG